MATTSFEQQRVVIAFSDVFGQIPADGRPTNSTPDIDVILNQQYGDGTFKNSEFPIGDWPGIARHGLVVVDGLRQAQIDELAALGVTPEEAAQLTPDKAAELGLRKYQYDTARSVGHQALVAVANSAPRTEHRRQNGQNGGEFHYGRTKSGIEVVGHAHFFRGLRDSGRLVDDSFGRFPDEAVVEAGVWKPGEQYRSRFASRLVDHPELLERCPTTGENSPIGQDPRKDGGVNYIDKFGNVIIGQHDMAATARLLGKSVGGAITMVAELPGTGDPKRVEVWVAPNLSQAPGDRLSVYLNPDDYPAGQPVNPGPGQVELARRTDDCNDSNNGAYARLTTELLGSPQHPLRPNQLDGINIRFEE